MATIYAVMNLTNYGNGLYPVGYTTNKAEAIRIKNMMQAEADKLAGDAMSNDSYGVYELRGL